MIWTLNSALPLLLAFALAAAGPNAALAQPKFSIPIDCEIGPGCLIQNYADRDPGPGVRDFACGSVSYDGHKGTDFRIRDVKAMREGVAVLAAAAGTVTATRDGVADVSIRAGGKAAVQGRECGNGVVIDHGGGWVSQYCHLRMGSVSVKSGDRVVPGAKLGLVGLSGMTEFPHVHFEVRKDQIPVDPFTSQPLAQRTGTCAAMGESLWTPAAAAKLAHPGAAFLAGGFTDRPVDFASIENGPPPDVGTAPEALVAYVRVVGVRAGDIETLEVTGPDGRVFSKKGPEPLAATKIHWLTFSGRRLNGARLQAGQYSAAYMLQRNGVVLIDRRFSAETAQ